ncbi:MAG: T9SS type A sorting domain-containing protein, partial [Balneolales bacterium]|nr:T9SS type A sorting domain-containing protein [Balneolales bacterium]
STSFTIEGLAPNTQFYWSVQAVDNLYNGSAFAEEQSFVSSSTSIESGDELPREVTLAQNYPNPFNPSTTIRFGLPEAEQVTLQVFDITGRLVAEVANASYQAGYHTINFNGSRLASGVYMYRLQTQNRVITKKMSLIK